MHVEAVLPNYVNPFVAKSRFKSPTKLAFNNVGYQPLKTGISCDIKKPETLEDIILDIPTKKAI